MLAVLLLLLLLVWRLLLPSTVHVGLTCVWHGVHVLMLIRERVLHRVLMLLGSRLSGTCPLLLLAPTAQVAWGRSTGCCISRSFAVVGTTSSAFLAAAAAASLALLLLRLPLLLSLVLLLHG
jgi:hypothetical protein